MASFHELIHKLMINTYVINSGGVDWMVERSLSMQEGRGRYPAPTAIIFKFAKLQFHFDVTFDSQQYSNFNINQLT